MAEAEAGAAPAHTTAEDSSSPEQPGHDVAAEAEAESDMSDSGEPAQGLGGASTDAAGPTISCGEEGEQDAAAAGQQADSEQAGSTAEPMQQEAEQTALPEDDQRQHDTSPAHADAAEQAGASPAGEARDGAPEPAAGELAAALAVETESARSMQNGLQETATAVQETAAAAVNGMPGLPEAAPAAAEAVVDSTQAADAPAADVTQLPAASTQVETTDSTSTAVVAAQQAAAAAAAGADTGLSEPLPAPTAAPAPAPAPAEPRATDQDTRQPSRAYFKDGVRAIDVEVDCGPGMPCKLLHVTLDVSALQGPSKPFLGGFKHKQQGTIFHHASIQTPQDQTQGKTGRKQQPAAGQGQAQAQQQEGCEGGVKQTRQTQTVKETSCSSQTVREAATQMAKVGLLLDCSGDRVLTPRPYVTAAVVEQCLEAAALTIQRFSRGWFARKRAGVLRDIKAERDAFLAETAAKSAQAVYDQKRHEVERRTHPLSKADFALLESELESWRQQQTAAIKNAGLVHQEEQAALQLLLAKETRLLHTLDKLRMAAHQEKQAMGRQVLGALAQPKAWPLSNGKKVLVHTPLTVRAAQLQQLYCGLTLPSLSLDERLDVLLHVKWLAKEWNSSATRELVELIYREADLLNRGRSPKTLDGLRKRIAGLFLTCCQNPAFNPEAARLRINAVGPNGPEAFEYVLEAQAAGAVAATAQ